MQSSIRVMPGCYITGQAAGMAAAVLCAAHSNNVHSIDVHELQQNDSFIAARVIAFCRSLSNNLPIRIPSCRGFIPQQEGARFYKPSRFQLFSHCLQ